MGHDLRNFRTDRVTAARQGDEKFGKRRVALMKLWEEVWLASRKRY